MRPLQGAPVDLLASSDKVMLRFYASGVRDASEVHVQIAGQEAPVFYSGPAGYFQGLDEVIVELPRSLAGMGRMARRPAPCLSTFNNRRPSRLRIPRRPA